MIDPTRAAILSEARRWIGTPFHHRASLRGTGTDCLGLIRGVWRALHGPEPEPLPPYSPDWAEATGAETMLEAARRILHEIPPGEARPGDVLLFRLRRDGPARHAGILACDPDGGRTLVHAHSPRHVTEIPFARPWQRRTAAAFAFPPLPGTGVKAQPPGQPVQTAASTQSGRSPAARAAFHAR